MRTIGQRQERVVLIALGIDTSGKKHVLGIHEGATENAAACGALLDDIIARGVATKRSMLFVVDGSKALVKAIRDRFGGRALGSVLKIAEAKSWIKTIG